ncbi:hypothetical protein [Nocardioides sp. KR10-350]|uniref:hypothetical protein n=1 Tax=Nocardioides cheoyonin TaxID=3156615 RepID=UPI0032B4CA01
MVRRTELLAAAARGLAGAMMMSALREVTLSLGLLRESPPDTMVREGTPASVEEVGDGTRSAVTELAHWAYGAGGGAAYALLPDALKVRGVSGPAYGLGVWLGFELLLAPLLGVRHPQGKVVGRAMLALDHVVYGVVVAGRFPPNR